MATDSGLVNERPIVVSGGIAPADAYRAATILRAEYDRLTRTYGLTRPGLLALADAFLRLSERDVTHSRELSRARSARYRARQKARRAA